MAFNYRVKLKRLVLLMLLRRRQKARAFYMRPLISEHFAQRCQIFWLHYEASDVEELRAFLSMRRAEFDLLHARVRHRLQSRSTHRRPLQSKERLAIFLRLAKFKSLFGIISCIIFRYLREGGSISAVAQEFVVGRMTIQALIISVAFLLAEELQSWQMPRPTTAK